MNGFELNKIAASILLSSLIIMIISTIVDVLYKPQEYTRHGENHIVSTAASEQKLEQVVLDISALMENANLDKGKSAAKKCIACHTFDKGGQNKVGPNLWNIVDNKKAHLGNSFNYSKPMLEKGGNWGYEELFAFLKNPKSYIKGTRMAFAGISKPQEIADLIAYLRSNSENPAPIPERK
ncbi:c-type cytochrome [Wolbachia endosymbiont of Pentidionis agamae]|uniref:c-type cytochrome n=1 Tax=Wolbachia endosymbiont of Pentidionis agamae TaxID=3110435 RepID=UPI002FD48D47